MVLYILFQILIANNAEPDQTPRYVASDLVLQNLPVVMALHCKLCLHILNTCIHVGELVYGLARWIHSKLQQRQNDNL